MEREAETSREQDHNAQNEMLKIIHGTPHQPPHPIVPRRRRTGTNDNQLPLRSGCLWGKVAICGPQEKIPRPLNTASTGDITRSMWACWEKRDRFHEMEIPETSEEQDHNMWNVGLNLITELSTGLHIQSCLREEELGRVAISCHFAVDCQCAELDEF